METHSYRLAMKVVRDELVNMIRQTLLTLNAVAEETGPQQCQLSN